MPENIKKINVKVIPGAKVEQIQVGMDENIKVWVKGKPIEGQANRAVIELLAKHYKVSKSSVRIILGMKSRNKVIEIM